MADAPIIIAGAGQAGLQAAASLRQEGFIGGIVLIGDEPGLPYQRPPLSKGYLKDGKADRLLLKSEDFFAKNAVTYISGTPVTSINRTNRTVSLSDGRALAYAHLILALGAQNRKPPLEGLELKGVYDLRTLADAEALRRAMTKAASIVVIGGGFIGLEVAATARTYGARVSVLEATPRLMSRAVTPAVSDYFTEAHADDGVDIKLGAMAQRIVGRDGHATAVHLKDGTSTTADLVLISTGVMANASIAAAAGLDVQDGIRVNAHLETSDPSISAIGDCASFPFGPDARYLRLESVQNAIDQAKCVARRLAGHPETYNRVPWFWSDQGPHKLQMAGLSAGATRTVARGSLAGGRLVVIAFKDDALVGVETVNAPAVHMASRKLLERGTPVTLKDIEAADFDLAALAKAGKTA
jgi:3-phenylpropionate/trans-cinnamate dioxygenase ferredoxin reductase component